MRDISIDRRRLAPNEKPAFMPPRFLSPYRQFEADSAPNPQYGSLVTNYAPLGTNEVSPCRWWISTSGTSRAVGHK